ncbi:MAG: hypothetical protein JW837_08365 [Sedimentisphaerales bacterium]|nr:hypothetical protein [Sedimentisphaerales bacterium]
MTKRNLTRCFRIALTIYVIAIILSVVFRIFDSTKGTVIYNTFKDMIPFVIVMPAAWFGYCLQRRLSYLQQLRTLWSRLVEAIQHGTHYTYLNNPTEEQYMDVLRSISISIDEVRGVFTNLNECDSKVGLYPFEPIKDIYGLIQDLGYANKTPKEKRDEIREKIFALWQEARRELLKEFDREVPTFSHSHWAQPDKSQVYDKYQIEKKAT